MPKRKMTDYFRSRKKRRTLKRKSTRKRQAVRYTRFQPRCSFRKLTYSDVISINAGVALPAAHLFRANSIFDPDYTGTGHQPLGHDDLAWLYNHYAVMGAKLTVKIMSEATDPLQVGIYLADDATAPAAATTLIENGRGPYTIVGTKTAGKGYATLTHRFSPKKFFCVRDRDLPSTMTADFSANPTEQAFWHIWVAAVNPLADPTAVNAQVTIEYLVKCSERKDTVAS